MSSIPANGIFLTEKLKMKIKMPNGWRTIKSLLHAAGRPGSSEVPRNPLTRWDVSSIPANGIFLTKKLKNKNKNAQRVEND